MSQARSRHSSIAWLAALSISSISTTALARPDTPNASDLFRYAAGETIKTFPSAGGNFLVHYAQSGLDAPPPDDANNNGTPDFVEDVASLYEEVLSFYRDQLGYHAPLSDATTPGNNGGDGRFDVYLLDFAGRADGSYEREQCSGDTCSGFMVQENDFAGYPYPTAMIGNRILASHEFFHAVQAGYDANQGPIIAEGTAVWATEKFDNTLDDFEGFVGGYLDRPDRSLDVVQPGPVDPFSYGAALFFEFLDEHVGGNIIRELWEDCVNGAEGVDNPVWFPALAALLARAHQTTFAAEFETFAEWNLMTGARADAKRSYARGSGYPLVRVMNATAPYRDDLLRLFESSTQYVAVAPAGRAQMTAVVNSTQDLAPMRLVMATRTGNKLSDFTEIPLPATGDLPTIATATADALIVFTVNTAQSGESLRGTFCIGTPDEVAPCKPPAPAVDAGVDAPSPPSDAGGCSVNHRPAPSTPLLAFTLAIAVAVLRRRRH